MRLFNEGGGRGGPVGCFRGTRGWKCDIPAPARGRAGAEGDVTAWCNSPKDNSSSFPRRPAGSASGPRPGSERLRRGDASCSRPTPCYDPSASHTYMQCRQGVTRSFPTIASVAYWGQDRRRIATSTPAARAVATPLRRSDSLPLRRNRNRSRSRLARDSTCSYCRAPHLQRAPRCLGRTSHSSPACSAFRALGEESASLVCHWGAEVSPLGSPPAPARRTTL